MEKGKHRRKSPTPSNQPKPESAAECSAEQPATESAAECRAEQLATESPECPHAVANNPKASILVPIFNAEPYLRQCLDSLVEQTLTDIEIICIDDGSTDASAQIIAEYAARDPRIRTISKPNTGYGDSMNKGVAAARGTWVGICEPDDFCDPRMFGDLVAAAERWDCDIAKANYSEHCEGRSPDPLQAVLGPFNYRRPFDPREQPQILLVAPTIWTAVYRRSMLIDAGVTFSPTPGASYQDASFGHQCWVSARRAVLLKPGYYHYRVDNAAASSKSDAKVFAVCGEYERSFAFLKERGEDDLRLFGPWLNVMRHGVYLWNYNRIAPACHREFAQRWEIDMVKAYDAGLLDASLMTPGYRSLLFELLDGPDAFCAAYPEEIPVPPIM